MKKLMVLVFLVSIIFLFCLKLFFQEQARDGLYFQEWNSDVLMQTLPIQRLRNNPLKSLKYLHKKPPGLDTIRLLIALSYNDSGNTIGLLHFVDSWLYTLWALIYAFLNTLFFIWLANLTVKRFALLGSFVWMIHPASISFSMLLDSTILTTLLITLFFYELWKIKNKKQKSIFILILLTTSMFYFRSFFQWYFLLVVFISLAILKVSCKKQLHYCFGVIVLIAPYLLKQYKIFGIIETSTFAGYHYCGMIQHQPTLDELDKNVHKFKGKYPKEARIIDDPYNNEDMYLDHLSYSSICKKRIITNPTNSLWNITKSIGQNLWIMVRPSSRYTPNIIIDRVFWREIFDFFSSRIPLTIIICTAIFSWLKQLEQNNWSGLRSHIGFLLPFCYIVLVISLSNRYGMLPNPDILQSEAHRLKFFIEPIYFIFIFYQAYRYVPNFL